MYRNIHHSKKMDIQGITVNIPPYGYVFNHINGKWEKREVYKRSVREKLQFWERPEPPQDYKLKRKKEVIAQQSDPEYVNYELQMYREQEWDRRLNGFWFYNKGQPTYITGLHYFYMTHWKIDIGYPSFRITDLEWFYFVEYCIQDPKSLGMVEVTRRRFGKTYRLGVFLYDLPSRSRNKNSGIQSKTAEDAEKGVFAKAVVTPFKTLPDFFIPTYDTEKGLTPKSEIRFFKTNKRGARVQADEDEKELESQIDWRNSKVVAYDGSKLHRYGADEVGKPCEFNVYDRHQVVRFCLMEDDKIVGKAVYTTTVEDEDSIGEGFKQLWKASDIRFRDDNGMTKSGLYQYFMPAYRTLKFDEYGFPDEEYGRQYFMNARAGLADDPRALASYIRKNPFTIEEAFFTEADNCHYDAMALNAQKDTLSWMDKNDLYVRGDISWNKGERDTTAIFTETSNGKFLVHKKLLDANLGFAFNNVERLGTKLKPLNNKRIAIGIDPFDHSIITGKGSDGAMAALHKFSAVDELSETFLVIYLGRPKKSELFYESMICACVFLGAEALVEDNKVGLINYFQYRGYERFLHKLKGSNKFGISASVKSHQQILEETDAHIKDNLHKNVFEVMIDDWLGFDVNDTTKFDIAMAAGYALILASANKIAPNTQTTNTLIDVDDLPF